MGQHAVDTLKQMLGEDRAAFLDYLQEPTRQQLSDAVVARLRADETALDADIQAGLAKLPGWLRGLASGALGGDSE